MRTENFHKSNHTMSNDFSTIVLNEAVRFGNRELRDLMRNIGQFRFGLEFEFNIEDVHAADALAVSGGEDLAATISNDIQIYAGIIYKNAVTSYNKILSNANTLKGILREIGEYKNGRLNDDEMDYFHYELINDEFLGNIFPIILEMMVHYDNLEKLVAKYAMDFERMGVDSEEFVRVFGGLFFVGLGTDIIMQISRERENIILGNNLDDNIDNIKDIINLFLKIEFEPWDNIKDELGLFFSGAMKVTSSKIDFIRNIINDYVPERVIESIKPDITVPKGIEVITVPLQFDDIADVMNGMADLIEVYGYTDGNTGLHVNISYPGFEDRVNPVKMMVLMDADFFQNLSPQFKRKVNVSKYPVRGDSVEPVTAFLRKRVGEQHVVDLLAIEYLRTGYRGLIGIFEKFMIGNSDKFRSINFDHMFNADVQSRRVEFRFLGGQDYEFRTEEMINDIMYISYVMLMTNQDFQKEEYMRGILRMLDRAVDDVYGDSGIDSFLGLADSIKSRNGIR